MKKWILFVSMIILTLCLILWAKGHTMREIRTEVNIAAPPSKVWNILTDLNHWQEWSPIINQADGTAALGSVINITMRNKDGNDGPKYAPVITEFESPRIFRWRAKMMFEAFFTNDKVFELESTSLGTKLIHKELFSGLMVPLFWGKMEDGVPPMLNAMNDALKVKAEKN